MRTLPLTYKTKRATKGLHGNVYKFPKKGAVLNQFGFNGQLKDNEIYSEGNAYDYGARIYDPRILRWFSRDPAYKRYPSWSPYNYSLSNPIFYVDKGGEIPIVIIDENTKTIIIYQPIFVVTKGPEAISLDDINMYQKELNALSKNIADNFIAVNNKTGIEYTISFSITLFEGGTINETENMIREAKKNSGLPFDGILSSMADKEFVNFYEEVKGEPADKATGKVIAVTVNNSKIILRGKLPKKREVVHEVFHLFGLPDSDDATGIMKYSNKIGKGDAVNKQNVEDAVNRSLKITNYINIIDSQGDWNVSGSDGYEFQLKVKPKDE